MAKLHPKAQKLVKDAAKLMLDTMLEREDGLAIMDAIAEVLADRYELDLAGVKKDIHERGTQQLYEGHIGPAIDRLAADLGYE